MADTGRPRGTGRRKEFPLVTAIQHHDIATVRHLLNCNVSPNEPYDDPPLIMAIIHKHLDIIQLLYKYNVEGYMGELNETEIHIAASVGHLPVLQFIWNQVKSRHKHGPSGPTEYLHCVTIGGETPLHSAAAAGSLDCVRFLLQEGAGVNSRTIHGLTPLHFAAERPSARELVEVLLEAGAQVDVVAWDGGCPIFTAIASKSDTVPVLLRAGSNLGLRNRYNETVAHVAAYHGTLSLLSTLMDAGVDLTARSITNSTILHRVAEAGNIDTIKWILQNTSLPAYEPNSYGWTPLHFAVARNHLGAAKFLVEHGADVFAVTLIPKNASALHLAAYFSGEDVKPSTAEETALISYLLAQGLDVSARAGESLLIGGYVPAHRDVSLLAGAHECGESLLEKFSSPSKTEGEDDDQVTPLDCAAEIGSIPKAQLLLAAGADINAQSPGKGWTALHRVTEPSPIMQFLVKKGADIQIKDYKGCSVVHYWCYYYRAAEPVRAFLVKMGVYKEDLEGDLDLKEVAALTKDVRRPYRLPNFR